MRQRKSIVSGRIVEEDQLIRFVLDPEKTVIPDIDANLPGRGTWIEASRTHIDEAVRKKLFNRSFKLSVNVESDLANRVEQRLQARILSLIGLARKSGDLIVGFHNVLASIGKGASGILFEANDGALANRKEVLKKIEQVQQDKFATTPASPNQQIRIVTTVTSSDLGLALGRDNVVHALVTNAGLNRKIAIALRKFEGMRQNKEQEPT